MSIILPKNREIKLTETASLSQKTVTINGRNFKILGKEEDISWVRHKLAEIHERTFDTLDQFKACLEISEFIHIFSEASKPLDRDLFDPNFNIAGEIKDEHEIRQFFSQLQMLTGNKGYRFEKMKSQGLEVELHLINRLTNLRESFHLTLSQEEPHKIASLAGDPILEATNKTGDIGTFVELLAKNQAFSGTVLYAKDDQVLFHGAYRNEIGTKYNLASAGKLFTSIAVMKLVDINNNLHALLPENSGWLPLVTDEERKSITVKSLLNHTSGFTENYHHRSDFLEIVRSDKHFATLDEYKFLVEDQKVEDPGRYHYSNTNYLLLGAIIEKVSQKSFFSFIEEMFKGMEMRNTTYEELQKEGKNQAVGYTLELSEDGQSFWKDNLDRHMKHGGPDGGCFSEAQDLLKFCKYCQHYLEEATGKKREKITLEDVKEHLPGFGAEENGNLLMVGHDGAFEGITTSINFCPRTAEVFIVLSNRGNGRQLFTKAIQTSFESLHSK